MKLFEVTNGFEGNSYSRVYVWTNTEESALVMASQAFKQVGQSYVGLGCRLLFESSTPAFCTIPSDDGWIVEKA